MANKGILEKNFPLAQKGYIFGRVYKWSITVRFFLKFRLEQMIQMKFNTWAYPRESLSWLNENEVAVLAVDGLLQGHCEILDTVS